jgi:hypothetical protein
MVAVTVTVVCRVSRIVRMQCIIVGIWRASVIGRDLPNVMWALGWVLSFSRYYRGVGRIVTVTRVRLFVFILGGFFVVVLLLNLLLLALLS